MTTLRVALCLLSFTLFCCGPIVPQRPRTEAGAPDAEEADATSPALPDAPSLVDAHAEDATILPDAHDDRAPDFQLVLIEPATALRAGETTLLHFRVDRIGGFDAPVLVDLWGLPNTVRGQPREARVDDGVLALELETDPEAPALEETPFAVQASARGIRRVLRATLHIE